MKKRFFMLAIIMAVLSIPVIALAVTVPENNSLVLPAWLTVLISIASIVAGIFIPKAPSGKVIVSKDMLLTIAKVTWAIVKSKKEESDGGKKITPEEWAIILSQGEGAAKYVAGLFGKNVDEIEALKNE